MMRTVTLRGNAANNFMAASTASHIFSQEEAEARVTRTVPGSYRDAIVFHLDQQGYKMSDAFMEALEKRDAEQEAAHREAARIQWKERLREKPSKVAKTTHQDPCCFCRQPIEASQTYHQKGSSKAHAGCCVP
jgi:hypothetical protein